jgi:hypothetical protein
MKDHGNDRLGQDRLAGSLRVLGWVALAGGVGWLTGHLGHRTVLAAAATGAEASPAAAAAGPAAMVTPFTAPAWGVRDGVELAALREAPAGVKRTAEAALWLGRANAAEIAQWWPALAGEKPQDWGLLNLVMVRWVELDPLAALARVSGTAEEFRAWWAWGKVDPILAMRQAKAFKSGHIWRVIQGAGAGDPLTAIRLAEENPEFAYPAVEEAIKDGLKDLSWRDSLDYRYAAATLREWAKYEPDRAFAWALDHAPKVDAATWTKLVEHLNESDPAQVTQALEKLPAGVTRQNVLLAQVAWTARHKLDDALLLAAAAESPTLRNRMLTQIGSSLATSDPARSLALFREVLENGGDQSERRVIRPDGESTSRSGESPTEVWLDLLIGHDPAKVVEITRAAGDHRLEEMARTLWLNRDFAGYTAAVRDLPEGEPRDRELDNLAAYLTRHPAPAGSAVVFPDALDWAAAISNPALRSNRARAVIESWLSYDEESAAAYFAEDGAATDDERATYEELKGGNP